jgi:hypothetical protein
VDDDLHRYLRENRDRYTREALTARAIEAGHDADTVEAAWRDLDAADAREATRGPSADMPPPNWNRRSPIRGVMTGLVVGVVFVFASYAVLSIYSTRTLLVEIVIAVVTSIVIWRVLIRLDSAAGETFGYVVLLGCGVPLLLATAVFGYCLVTGFKLTGN